MAILVLTSVAVPMVPRGTAPALAGNVNVTPPPISAPPIPYNFRQGTALRQNGHSLIDYVANLSASLDISRRGDTRGSVSAISELFASGFESAGEINAAPMPTPQGKKTPTPTPTPSPEPTVVPLSTPWCDPIDCEPTNEPPVSVPGGPYSGQVGQNIQFNGSGSYDTDGDIISYLWNFGDGTTSTTMNPQKAYAAAGTYNVSLRVRDNSLAYNYGYTTVTVSAAPTPTPTPTPTPVPALVCDRANPRLCPINATGSTSLYSRNFSWGSGIVSLPGRSGLDAGFGISYNSLVWIKSGGSIVFDPDASDVSPGFRMGFPVVEPSYADADTGKVTFVMVTPAGARVEFRQVTGSTDTFETANSSYAQLKVDGSGAPENLSLIVTGTDGTQMSYVWNSGAYRCMQIKDRNGNYISIVYDPYGNLQSVTDTLGRVVTVNYDQGYPSSVTQTWKDNNGAGADALHTYVTFAYTNIALNTNFSGLTIMGPTNGTSIKVLQKIAYADGSSTTFDYNAYAQVYKVSNNAADGHLLNYVKTSLENPAANQTDCPRFSETRSWVENFNQDQNGTAQEAVAANQFIPDQTYSTPAGTGAATLIQVSLAGDPSGSVSKAFVEPSGWKEGLTVATEDWANGASGLERKRWTWTNYTQDDTALSYTLNPRPTESKVGDTTNVKRTTTEYYPVSSGSPIALYGLVKEVKVYAADQTTVLKKVSTEYNLDSVYTSKRIIGLPSRIEVWGWDDSTTALEYVSKVTYAYDEGDFADSGLSQNIIPIQHDDTHYGAPFITGRGNLTSTTRWDVTQPTNSAAAITSSVKYNTAGAPVAQITPWDGAQTRTVKIGYADSWNDPASRTTFAYPTNVTDPAGNSSTVIYRHDIGANVHAQSPEPAGNSQGKITERLFDSIGRLSKETVVNSGAYTRYEYPANGVQSKVFTTVVDTNNNGADSADEVLTESWVDGAGRVRRSRTEHPGSVGGYAGSLTEYNLLGEIKRQSVPTEIDSNWNPAGDDAVSGFLWTAKEYDWKGRITREINTDGTDKLYSYDGCGCAGGQITTIKGELVPRDDQPSVMARRTQKIYADILGRTYKTEALKWDGTVYTTVVNTFNGRDQVTLSRQYAGTTSNSTYQDTTATYDGYGRPLTNHVPRQDSGKNTAYSYYPDDTVQTKTDARGAITAFTYNVQGLVVQIDYTMPTSSNLSSNIQMLPPPPCDPYTDPNCEPDPTPTPPPDPTPTPTPTPTPNPTPTPLPVSENSQVTFGYDNLGNRTRMTDSMGEVTYSYDQLSRLTGESRHFYGPFVGSDLQQAPGGVGIFNISYEYELAGGLKSITDPYGQTATYTQNRTGATEAVTGSQFAGENHIYATNTKYRAWGAIKSVDYVNNAGTSRENYSYNNRLLPQTYSLYHLANGVTSVQKQYQYVGDGSVKYIKDGDPNGAGTMFDRSYKLDYAGRLTDARTGQEARGGSMPAATERPYALQNQYDAFGNSTSTTLDQWSTGASPVTKSYVNDRAAGSGYDSDGRLTSSDGLQYSYDAGGVQYLINRPDNYLQYRWWDGEGRLAREQISDFITTDPNYPNGYYQPRADAKYYVRSTLMNGDVLSEALRDGRKEATYVYGFGKVLGVQKVNSYANPPSQTITWSYSDISQTSVRDTSQASTDPLAVTQHELDPFNNDVGVSPPDPGSPDPGSGGGGEPWDYPRYGSSYSGGGYCTVDGVETSCASAMQMLENGSAIQCPDNYCGPVGYNGQLYTLNTTALSMGIGTQGVGVGYLPTGVGFNGTSFQTNGMAINFGIGPYGLSLPGIGEVSIAQLDGVSDNYWSTTIARYQASWNNEQGLGNDGPGISNEPSRPLTKAEKEVLDKKISSMTSNAACLDKLNAVLKQLGSKYKGGFNQYFRDVLNSKNGYELVVTKSPVEGKASASALFGEITLNSRVSMENHDVDLIHEMFHAVRKGNFLHMQIAQAIANVEGLNIDNLKSWYKNNAPSVVDPGGGLINSFIEQYCKGGSQNWAGWLARFK